MIYSRWLKPGFDCLAGIVLSLASLPIAVVVVLALFFSGRGVFFRQQRIGFKGRPFGIIKFKTLLDLHDHFGVPLPDSQRTFPLGTWLRKTHLDEIPQLWMIATGGLSLIGPRPLLLDYLPRYTPNQALRHSVKPGLLGLSQALGGNALPYHQRLRLDSWYAAHLSFSLDVLILARSLRQLFRRSSPPHFSAEFQP